MKMNKSVIIVQLGYIKREDDNFFSKYKYSELKTKTLKELKELYNKENPRYRKR